jgi:ubiquinone/menaquinone biosynthesis C-methylase UbiE
MMAAVAEAARGRGLSNLETCVTPAEALPFANAAFDFLGCRFSAHHWRDFHAGLREARRVLEPGATAVFIDVVSPAPPRSTRICRPWNCCAILRISATIR